MELLSSDAEVELQKEGKEKPVGGTSNSKILHVQRKLSEVRLAADFLQYQEIHVCVTSVNLWGYF